jgi:hypothetical protein
VGAGQLRLLTYTGKAILKFKYGIRKLRAEENRISAEHEAKGKLLGIKTGKKGLRDGCCNVHSFKK